MRQAFEGVPSIIRRVLAFAIDLIVLNLTVFYPFRKLVVGIAPAGSLIGAYGYISGNAGARAMLYATVFAMTIMALLYFSVLEYKTGQTVGKMLLKLNVKSVNKRLSYWQCLLRALIVVPFFPFYILWLADPIFALFNKEQQRLMEWLSKTKTVQVYNAQGWNR